MLAGRSLDRRPHLSYYYTATTTYHHVFSLFWAPYARHSIKSGRFDFVYVCVCVCVCCDCAARIHKVMKRMSRRFGISENVRETNSLIYRRVDA